MASQVVDLTGNKPMAKQTARKSVGRRQLASNAIRKNAKEVVEKGNIFPFLYFQMQLEEHIDSVIAEKLEKMKTDLLRAEVRQELMAEMSKLNFTPQLFCSNKAL